MKIHQTESPAVEPHLQIANVSAGVLGRPTRRQRYSPVNSAHLTDGESVGTKRKVVTRVPQPIEEREVVASVVQRKRVSAQRIYTHILYRAEGRAERGA